MRRMVFQDADGHACSIQESGAAAVGDEDGEWLWLGLNEGTHFGSSMARMHLSRRQVA